MSGYAAHCTRNGREYNQCEYAKLILSRQVSHLYLMDQQHFRIQNPDGLSLEIRCDVFDRLTVADAVLLFGHIADVRH